MSIVSRIEEQFNKVEESRSEMKGRVNLLEEQKANVDKEHKELKKEYKAMGKVLDILKTYSTLKEQVLRGKIDKIVTKGLRLIFGEGYKSKLEFGISRNQVVIKPEIITEVNGEELQTGVAEAHGGGIVNVCSFLYQILVLALVRPRQRQVIFLDECFKNVCEDDLEATAEFVKSLNKSLGIQIILITHRKQLHDVADCLYEFSLSKGITKVKKIR